jgi:endoglycosylceramidase
MLQSYFLQLGRLSEYKPCIILESPPKKDYIFSVKPVIFLTAMFACSGIFSAGCNGQNKSSLVSDTAADMDLDALADNGDHTAISDVTGECTGPVQPLYMNDGTHIRDRQGRTLILRGVNFPSGDVEYCKGKPPDSDLADLKFISESGFNAIRLVINWDRIEPEPWKIDTDYVKLVARHAGLASGLGLYVIIDLHQDLFGLGFGLHGAPLWACDSEIYKTFEPVEPWFFNYFSKEVSACFDKFWKDKELQHHQQNAAHAVASAVAGFDNVMGFDPHNEPFPGTFSFEIFEQDYLWPFYTTFAETTGEVLPGRLLFFEPSVLFSVYLATSFPAPGSLLHAVFFPHYYNTSVETKKLWDGNAGYDVSAMSAATNEAQRLIVPWGLGELGGAMETPNLDKYLYSLYGLLDEAQAGSFLWIFTRGTSGFGLVDQKTGKWHSHARAFLRPAPSAVAGTPLHFSWNHETGIFEMQWNEDPCAGSTEIIVPAWVKKVGFTLEVDGAGVEPVTDSVTDRIIITGGRGGSRLLSITVLGTYPD